MRTLILASFVFSLGCSDNAGTFMCSSDRDCTTPGGADKCIGGYCAGPDPSCPSGYRYDTTAGGDASQCVPIGIGQDMSVSADMSVFHETPDLATADMAQTIDLTTTGAAWQVVTGGNTSTDYQGIYGIDNKPGNIFIAGNDGTVGTWTGTNFTFKSATSSVLNGICGSSATDLYLVGSNTILHSANGSSWSAPTTPPPTLMSDLYYGCFAVSTTDVYVVGYNITNSAGIIYHTADHGATWQPQTISGTTSVGIMHSVWASSPTDVYIVGEQGVILHSNGQPGGGGPAVFAAQTSGLTKTLWSIWGSGPNDIYIAASGGYVLHSAGGGSWGTPITIGTQDIQGVWGTSSSNIYFVGANGVVFHSPGGLAFDARNSSTTANLRRVFATTGLAIAVGTSGAIVEGQ